MLFGLYNFIICLHMVQKSSIINQVFLNGWNMPEFKDLRKKVRRRRIETMLLAGYAVAVTCALFISLLNQNMASVTSKTEVTDNYDFGSDILTPAFIDSADNNPFEQVYDDIQNIKLISDLPQISQKFVLAQNDEKEVIMPGTPRPKSRLQYGSMEGIYQKERHIMMVESGDTFIGLLNRLGMASKDATEAYNTLRKVFDARNLRVGQYFILTGTFNVQNHELETLDTLVIEPERGTRYTLYTNEYDKFETKVEQEKFARDIRVVRGEVKGSVSASLAKAGVPSKYRGEVINIFGHMLNFGRDIHSGDTFELKYEVNKDSFGDVVKNGNLLYASFSTKNRQYKLYRYQNVFYNEKGETKKTGLDKKPLAARNARISSLFGYRRHPILKTQKFHSGVDYAAPRGTAIYASGNGRVEMARYVNGYGNYVKIRHNSEYETAYGHMQRFASGIRPGVSVRKGQIIGYVGNTGRSTGPHLHFEILRHGQRINPLKAAVATGNDLGGRQLADFKRQVAQINASQEKIAKKEHKPLVIAKAEPPALKMTVAQNAELIRMAQKDLPDTLKLFPKNITGEDDTIEETDSDNQNETVVSLPETAEISVKIEKDSSTDTTIQTQKIAVSKLIENELQKTDVASTEENKATTTTSTQASAEKASVETEKTQEDPTNTNYKGKIIYPVQSATKAREQRLLANRKIVMPGKRRPQRRAARTARRR